MAKAKKTNGRAKAHKAEPKFETRFETNGARKQVTHALARVQEGFREAGEAIREAGETMGGESRKVALTLVNHAQDNVVYSFEALRDTLQAETFAEAVKIQQAAMAEMFRRSLRQMREVGEIVSHSGTKTLKPITKFVSALRDTRTAA
jgi:hypothetical protein